MSIFLLNLLIVIIIILVLTQIKLNYSLFAREPNRRLFNIDALICKKRSISVKTFSNSWSEEPNLGTATISELSCLIFRSFSPIFSMLCGE